MDEIRLHPEGASLEVGDEIDVFISKIRDDGRVDCSLRPYGAKEKLEESEVIILSALKASINHSLEIGDKSDPKEIMQMLNIPKSIFKSACGGLYKKGFIDKPKPAQICLREEHYDTVNTNNFKDTKPIKNIQDIRSKDDPVDESMRESRDFEEFGPLGLKQEKDRFSNYDPETYGRKVIVRGLPYTMEEEEARELFGEYGKIISLGGMANRLGKRT